MTKNHRTVQELEHIPLEVPVSDLGCASALVALGYRLVALDKEDSNRVNFVFRKEADIQAVIDDYFCDRLVVKARSLWDSAKALKCKLRS